MVAIALVLFGTLPAAGAESQSPPAVAEPVAGQPAARMLRTGYFHGIPWTAGERLGPADVELLGRALRDPDDKPYWRNAVWLLGVVAGPAAVDELIAFQERQEGEVDSETFQTLLQVNQALGLAARQPGSRALDYLSEGRTPAVWGARARWSYRGVEGRARNLLLLKLAINGLGLAGTEEARRSLEALERELDPETRRICRSNLDEALARNAEIAAIGHDEYFRRHPSQE